MTVVTTTCRCWVKWGRLATYVALSRPPPLAQLLSLGLPVGLRDIIDGGPPNGIRSRLAGMFEDID